MVHIGEVNYKIGEIANLAEVSKRTVDYYTKLGLLNPVRSENNYRYYTGEDLVRLKIIEAMKKKRYTLQEIKNELGSINELFSNKHNTYKATNETEVNIEYLRKQIKQLEQQLDQLQPLTAHNKEGVIQLKNRIMTQSMTLMHSLALYLNEISYL